jgi:hypothetical protein
MGIFTQNHKGIYFKTSSSSIQYTNGGSDVMTFLSSGNVGIGATSPTAPLDVNGVIRSRGGSYSADTDTRTDVGLVIPENDFIYTADGSDYLRKLIGKNNDVITIGESGTSLIDGINLSPGTTGGYVQILNNASIAAKFVNGRLGIATTNPEAKLHVDSGDLGTTNNNTTTQAIFSADNANVSKLYIQDYRTADGSDWTTSGKRIQEKIDSTWMGYVQFNGDSNNGGVSFGTGTNSTQGNVAERMRITSTGNVGINNTSPVNGKLVVTSTEENLLNTVRIQHTRSNSDFGSRALEVDMNLSGADTTTADRVNRGILVDLDSSADGDAANEHRIYGIESDVKFTGFSDIARAGYFLAESNYTGAKTAQLVGAYGQAIHDAGNAAGGVSNMYGLYGYSSIQDLGDVDNAFGVYGLVDIGTNRGNVDVGVTKAVEGEISINKASAISYGTMIGISSIIDNNEGAVPNFGSQYLFKGDYQGDKGDNAYGIYTEGDKHYFAGNIGIGTTSPSKKLTIGSGDLLFTGNYSSKLIVNGDNTSNTPMLLVGEQQVYGVGFRWNSGRDLDIVGYDNSNVFSTSGVTMGKFITKSGLSAANSVFYWGGNVGIGTATPGTKLEVSSSGANGVLISKDTSTTSNSGRLFFETDTVSEGFSFLNSNGLMSIRSQAQAGATSGNVRVAINGSGNVGIGTTSPSADETNNGIPRLQVNTATAVLGEFPLAARFTTGTDAGDNSGVSVLINSGNDRGLMISAGRAVSNRSRATLNLVQYDGNELVDGITLYQPNSASAGATTGTNVGIGTDSPGAKLDVKGSYGDVIKAVSGSQNITTNFVAPSTGSGRNNITSTAGEFNIGTTDAQPFDLVTNSISRIAILSSGYVGIGTTNPIAKLDVSGAIRSSHAVYNDINGIRLINPGGGSGNSLGNSGTVGAIKISLPQSWTSTMMRMSIKVYNYSEEKSFTVHCGGYNHGSSSSWINEFAYIESSSSEDLNFTVRFGYDSNNKCCIYIGELNSTWYYPKVFVTDFQAGFNNTTGDKWDNGWSISMETSAFENISQTRTNCQVNNWKRNGSDLYYGSGTGNVGIGTTSPSEKLTVDGKIRSLGDTSSADFYSVGNDALVVNNGSSNLKFWNNGSERMRINSSMVTLESVQLVLAINCTLMVL